MKSPSLIYSLWEQCTYFFWFWLKFWVMDGKNMYFFSEVETSLHTFLPYKSRAEGPVALLHLQWTCCKLCWTCECSRVWTWRRSGFSFSFGCSLTPQDVSGFTGLDLSLSHTHTSAGSPSLWGVSIDWAQSWGPPPPPRMCVFELMCAWATCVCADAFSFRLAVRMNLIL